MKIKICEKCGNKIRPKVEGYFQIDTYERGKLVKTGFLHKKCNTQIEKEKETLAKTFGNIGNIMNKLNETLGLNTDQVYEIKP